jgi:hypothetical protein
MSRAFAFATLVVTLVCVCARTHQSIGATPEIFVLVALLQHAAEPTITPQAGLTPQPAGRAATCCQCGLIRADAG